VAVPVLAARVRIADEEQLPLRLVARHQDEDRLGLIEPGEVQQVAVLSIFIVDVERVDACGGAPEDGD
jgi:hypothetical protein